MWCRGVARGGNSTACTGEAAEAFVQAGGGLLTASRTQQGQTRELQEMFEHDACGHGRAGGRCKRISAEGGPAEVNPPEVAFSW